jgi:hypothetical protein
MRQFRVGFDRRPGPNTPRAINRGFHGRDMLVFRGTETPEFIDLNAARLHAANLHVMEARAEAPAPANLASSGNIRIARA